MKDKSRKPLTDKQLAEGVLSGWLYGTRRVRSTRRTRRAIVAVVEVRVPLKVAKDVNEQFVKTGSPLNY